MKYILFLVLTLISLSGFATDNCGAPRILDFDFAEEVQKECSPQDLAERKKSGESYGLISYSRVNDDELCKCLESAKFNKEVVPFFRKRSFNHYEYDYSIRKKLNHSLNDLISNFTKFNNLLLSKDHPGSLLEEGQKLCDFKVFAEELKKLQKDDVNCPAPPGFKDKRLQDIFGTTNMDEMPMKLEKKGNEVSPKSCISQNLYLNLRSSNGAASTGFGYIKNLDSDTFKEAFHNPENDSLKTPLKDLLSYDVIFNLAYRDPDFYKNIKDKIRGVKNPFSLYSDPDVLKSAYKSLNNSCLQLTSSLKQYLCAGEYPDMHPAVLNLHLDDYFKNERDPVMKRSMRDFFTWDFACNENKSAIRTRRSAKDFLEGNKLRLSKREPTQLDKEIEQQVLIKMATKDVFAKDSSSDYSKFNAMFCQGREGTKIKPEELSGELNEMLKSYILSKSSMVDIQGIINSAEIGIKINIDGNPMFTLADKAGLEAGKLPHISQIKWEQLIAPHLKGLSEEEKGQLYAMIEMQTNRRFTEMEDLKKKLGGGPYESVTLAELDGITRGDKTVTEAVKERLLTQASAFMGPSQKDQNIIDPINHITKRHGDIQQDILVNENLVQDLLFSNTSVDAVRAQAAAYNNNDGTYQRLASDSKPSKTHGFASDSSSAEDPKTETPTPTQGPASVTPKEIPEITSYSNIQNDSTVTSSPVSSSFSEAKFQNSSTSSSIEKLKDVYDPGPSSDRPRTESSKSSALQDEIKRIKDEIAKSQADYNSASEAFKDLNKIATPTSVSQTSSSRSTPAGQPSSNYRYAKNLPVKSTNGEYYNPENKGSELSSKSGAQSFAEAGKKSHNGDKASGAAGAAGASDASGGTGGAGGAGAAGGISGTGASVAGVGGQVEDKGRGPASVEETEEDIKKRKNLASYEFHKYIPHAVFDVVGSVDRVVLLLGLEGKTFKTIEAIEEVDKDTQKLSIKYYQRTYDFVPEGEFEEFKEEFSSKESREKAHEAYFSYPRTKDNLTVSKKYSKATREVAKEVVTHNYVLKIQNDILSEEDIRNTINKVMEQLQ